MQVCVDFKTDDNQLGDVLKEKALFKLSSLASALLYKSCCLNYFLKVVVSLVIRVQMLLFLEHSWRIKNNVPESSSKFSNN